MKSFKEFLLEQELESKISASIRRNKELAGLVEPAYLQRYAIQVFVIGGPDLLVEHETCQKFKKTNNFYMVHPEDKNIPVKRHYHAVDKHKKDIYAINVDGTSHHKSSNGVVIPKKETQNLKKWEL